MRVFAIVPVATLTLAALLSGCNRDSAGPGAAAPPGGGTTSPPPATTPTPAVPPASAASG